MTYIRAYMWQWEYLTDCNCVCYFVAWFCGVFYMEINRGMRAWSLASREMGPSECLHSISEPSLLMWLYRASSWTCSLTTSQQHWRRNRAWPAALTHNNCCNIRGCSVFYWQSLWFLNVRQDALFKCLHVATTKKKVPETFTMCAGGLV